MASLHDEGLSVSYTYDDSGIRTSKTVNGTKTQYYLNGSTILTQITGDDRLDFFYDENGLLIGFSYNGEKYYYFRNLQNDIVSIYDGNGNQVVSYTYDSWGKLLSIEGSAKDTIGVLNPFRYRGYYYDTESGFYYLNSRYYDPVVGRFLNADGLIDSRGHVTQNLFQYCGNNFVNYLDPSGNFAITLSSGLVLAGTLLAMYVAQHAPQFSELVNNIIVGIAEATDWLVTSLTSLFSNEESEDKAQSQADAYRALQNTVIYRYGGKNPGNLTPRRNRDEATGLSFSLVPRRGCVMTTIGAINSTGVVYAVIDGPTHVSIRPVQGTVEDWIEEGSTSIYTQAVKSVVVKWDGG